MLQLLVELDLSALLEQMKLLIIQLIHVLQVNIVLLELVLEHLALLELIEIK